VSVALQDDHGKKLDLLARIDVSQFFSQTASMPLLFNKRHHCYLTPYSEETLRSLTGSWPSLRDYQNWKHGVRCICSHCASLLFSSNEVSTNVQARLPRDAVVLSLTQGQVVVVLSREAGLVLKLQSHIFARAYTEISVEAARVFAEVGMGEMVPALRSAGPLEEDRIYYAVTEFVPNRPPLFSSFNGRFWPGTLEKHVMPLLQEFHTRRGMRVLTGGDWAESIRKKFTDKELDDGCREALAGTLAKLEQNNSMFMPAGMISGDLKPENVHYNGSRWVILDWSNVRECALLPDILCHLFYMVAANAKSPDSVALQRFLRGRTALGNLPKLPQHSLEVWQRWMSRWLGRGVSEPMLRLQIEGSVWDWLGTMTHPWNPAGGLWSHMSPSDCFLKICSSR
jgi:hypothetical protein